jgi:cobalt-zinc-cadmium efflux system outer membrane protein
MAMAKRTIIKTETSPLPHFWLIMLLALMVGCQSAGQPRIASHQEIPAVPVAIDDDSELVDIETVSFVDKADTPAETWTPLVDQSVAMESQVGLTIESAESMAVVSHPAIIEANARVDSACGQYVQAGLPFNPVLQYQSDEIGNDTSSGIHTVNLSQQFVTANKLGLARQVQAQVVQKERARLQTTQLKVLTRVRASFAAALVAQTRSDIANQIVELAEKSVTSVSELYEAEEVSKIEVLQAKVEAEQARIASENAKTQLSANRRALAAAIGTSELPSDVLVGDPAADLTDTPWEQLVSEIAAASPELAAAGSELERARWSLSLACAQITPNVTGQAGVGYDAATDDTFAMIGVSVPLPIRNRNQGNIRSARANIVAASAAIDRTRLSLDGRLADAVGRYQIARQRYVRLHATVLPSAEETFDLSRKAFQAGETGYLQLLTTQRTLFNTQLSLLDALAQAKNAMADIDGYLVNLPQ